MDYLQNIIEHKRRELSKNRAAVPLERLTEGLDVQKRRSFRKSLLHKKPALIAEIKRRSPSKGELSDVVNPVETAKTYADAGAAAVSVLTDGRFFGGSPEDLRGIVQGIDVPVLRKDFIIDPYQIYESKYFGADAVLLISGCLERGQLSELLHTAVGVGLEVLVEVECRNDIEKLTGIPVEIIGVNNRNLHTFELNIKTSFDLFDALPRESTKISESGLSSADQLAALHRKGYEGFLIGEKLMRSHNPGEAVKNLIDEFNRLTDA